MVSLQRHKQEAEAQQGVPGELDLVSCWIPKLVLFIHFCMWFQDTRAGRGLGMVATPVILATQE